MRNAVVYLCLAVTTVLFYGVAAGGEGKGDSMRKYNQLTPEEHRIIVEKGTEYPGTGEYLHNKEPGTYVCKRCDAPLYRSQDKFDSGCGWPSFDDEIPGAVERRPDADGRRVEILCAACGAHLGHVFAGERLTEKNVRHCVNSLSMKFIPAKTKPATVAYFAAGCFWGVEHWFKKEPGVVSTEVGYMGGALDNPTYRQVSGGDTGHAETLKVVFDPGKTSFEKLCRLFFEIHDFTQIDRQGPDVGQQYRSEIFTVDADQAKTAESIIAELKTLGYKPATKIAPAVAFWKAEEYHQDYYGKNGKEPYCHARKRVF